MKLRDIITNIDAYQIIFVDSGLKIKSTKSIDFGDYAEYDCIEIDEEVIDTQMYPQMYFHISLYQQPLYNYLDGFPIHHR